jgi:hypothetical protein
MLKIVPLSLKEANLLVANWHRHHKPARGCKFAIGVADESGIHGAAICGRPSARNIDYRTTLEVTRLVTNGTKNACSILYAAAARIAREMGYEKIITYILVSETGHSLKVSGWQERDEITLGRQWKHTDGNPRRTDQPTCDKRQFFKTLAPPNNRLHLTAFGVEQLQHIPLQASLFADDQPATHGGR